MTKIIEKSKIPTVTRFLDEEEEALYKLTESEDYVPSPNELTPELLEFYKQSTLSSLQVNRSKSS